MPDKVRTQQHANSVVDAIEFRFDVNNNVIASITGHTTFAEGGNSPLTTYEVVLPNAQFKTDVLALRTNRALPFWKTQEGL